MDWHKWLQERHSFSLAFLEDNFYTYPLNQQLSSMERVIKFRLWEEFPKYEVGDNGSIWSLNYNNTQQRHEIKQHIDKYGYKYVVLVVDGKRYKRLVHRMVAISFIENPENKPQVNHVDGNKINNIVENLEWNTARENVIHSYASNLKRTTEKQKLVASIRYSGTNNPKCKLTKEIVSEIRKLRGEGNTLDELSVRYNISKSQVSSICTFKTWKQ